MTLPGWPPDSPFPESQHEPSPGAGPDFPGSSGGRNWHGLNAEVRYLPLTDPRFHGTEIKEKEK